MDGIVLDSGVGGARDVLRHHDCAMLHRDGAIGNFDCVLTKSYRVATRSERLTISTPSIGQGLGRSCYSRSPCWTRLRCCLHLCSERLLIGIRNASVRAVVETTSTEEHKSLRLSMVTSQLKCALGAQALDNKISISLWYTSNAREVPLDENKFRVAHNAGLDIRMHHHLWNIIPAFE